MRKLSFLLTIAAMFLAGCENEGDNGGKSKEAGGDPEVPTYTITLNDDGHGTAVATVEGKEVVEAEAGAAVIITAIPDKGYVFGTWTCEDNALLNDSREVSNTFIMPEGDVEIAIEFIDSDLDVFTKIIEEPLREYCERFDTDGDGKLSLSEADNVKSIVYYSGPVIDVEGADPTYPVIETLAGVEYFKNLELLSCTFSHLTSVDLSKNTKLISLNCSVNKISSLNLSGCRALTKLNCVSNELTSLDVSGNSVLEKLECEHNSLLSLDISNNTSLVYLNCCSNHISALDITNMAMNDEDSYTVYCGGQMAGNTTPVQLALTMRDDQKHHWSSVLATDESSLHPRNEGVVVAE